MRAVASSPCRRSQACGSSLPGSTPNAAQHEFWESQNGQQSGDPVKLAQALLTLADEQPPPRRFIAGADAIAQPEQHVAQFQAEIDAYRDLSSSLAIDEAPTTAIRNLS